MSRRVFRVPCVLMGAALIVLAVSIALLEFNTVCLKQNIMLNKMVCITE